MWCGTVWYLVAGGHSSQSDAQTRTVLHDAVHTGVAQCIGEEGDNGRVALAALVCVDQTQRVQSTGLGVGPAGRGLAAAGQVGLQQVHRLVHVALVNHADGRDSVELRPVRSLQLDSIRANSEKKQKKRCTI